MNSRTFLSLRRTWRTGGALASLVVAAILAATTNAASAGPCLPSFSCSVSDPDVYAISYSVTSTTPMTITDIVDLYNGHHVGEQGDFSGPASLATGSGTLYAGRWRGTDAHYLMGLAGSDLVMMMNPASAALMVGKPFDTLINGIGPGGVPNPYPVSGAEAVIVDRLMFRPAEWNNDVASFFDLTYRPNRLIPSVLIGPGSGTQTLTVMSFTDGKVIGSVSIQTASVPEPQTWMSMLAGIGVVGFCLRRSARTDPARMLRRE